MENYYTVAKVIDELLLKMGEDSNHTFSRLLPHAYDYLDKYKRETSRQVKSVKLKMNAHRAVKLPDDFSELSKIGVAVGRYVRVLAYNSSLSNLSECENPPARIYDHPSKDDYWYPFMGYPGKEVLGYGAGGFDDCYSLDHTARLLRFGSAVNVGEIYLEYLSTEFSPCGETPINPLAKPAMENYILWKHYLFRRDSIYQQYETYFYQEDRKLKRSFDPWSPADGWQSMEENYTLGPK